VTDLVLDLVQSIDEPARARAFVGGPLTAHPRDTRDDALLLVSELVSNVVQHGALPARILLEVTGTRVHVVVHDSGGGIPEGPAARDHEAPNGRGLIIVAAVATAWGISTVAGQIGKGVWFDLAVGA
jgi:two-component sensor histidine kinase